MDVENGEKAENEEVGLLGSDSLTSPQGTGFFEAWKLPGCLVWHLLHSVFSFRSWWLTLFYTGFHSTLSTQVTFYYIDIGGIYGDILAGFISDVIDTRAVTSVAFLLLSISALVLYQAYGSLSVIINTSLMFVSDLLVNGSYSLITTAVGADLVIQDLIKGNSRALATVTAILDGTGSVGLVVGPLLAGYISNHGWNSEFLMLIVAIFFAGIFMVRVAKAEIKEKLNEGKWF